MSSCHSSSETSNIIRLIVKHSCITDDLAVDNLRFYIAMASLRFPLGEYSTFGSSFLNINRIKKRVQASVCLFVSVCLPIYAMPLSVPNYRPCQTQEAWVSVAVCVLNKMYLFFKYVATGFSKKKVRTLAKATVTVIAATMAT